MIRKIVGSTESTGCLELVKKYMDQFMVRSSGYGRFSKIKISEAVCDREL